MAEIYDVIGVGFGPSNLALALCIHEKNIDSGTGIKSIFFEKQETFLWHNNMLLENATLQVSFLKDLVTLRNPSSPFSFLNYLNHVGRLEDFINLKTFFPTRIEYADYLKWAAAQIDWMTKYGSQVEEIKPVTVDGEVKYLDVHVRNIQSNLVANYRTRNLVVGVGLQPTLPLENVESERVFHSSNLLKFIQRHTDIADRRFLVVGGGQSAAEVVNYLYENFKESKVTAVFSGFGYKPADDSSFVNQIFDGSSVDLFYGASESMKDFLLREHRNTNYSVVDIALIEELYRKAYADKVKNTKRLSLRRLSRLEKVVENETAVTAHIRDSYSGKVCVEKFDAIVLATGYKPGRLANLAPEISEYIKLNKNGEEILERNYAVKAAGNIKTRIYLQGATESQHGLTSTLLSALSVRSGEIVDDIIKFKDVSCALRYPTGSNELSHVV